MSQQPLLRRLSLARARPHHVLGLSTPDLAAQALLLQILDASDLGERARRACLRSSWPILRVWRSMIQEEELAPALDLPLWPAMDDYGFKLTRRRDLPRGLSRGLRRALWTEFAPQLREAATLPLGDPREVAATRMAVEQWWRWAGARVFSELAEALDGHGMETLDRVEIPSTKDGLRRLMGRDGHTWALPALSAASRAAWLDPESPQRRLRRAAAALEPHGVEQAVRQGADPAELDPLGLDALGALAIAPCAAHESFTRRSLACARILAPLCDPDWVWSAHPWSPDPAELALAHGREELASLIRAERERRQIEAELEGGSERRGGSGRRL